MLVPSLKVFLHQTIIGARFRFRVAAAVIRLSPG
jgi:hypothetical protein